jgi:orotidine-5'-phosphate decarboxylase
MIARRLSVSSFGDRLQQGFKSKGQLCVGIDPSYEQLQSWGLPQSKDGVRSFSMAVLDAAANQVAVIKPQVAFFEQFGPGGFDVLADVMKEASSRGLLVIADAKRGDIGSTMNGYAKAWLSEEAVFVCDALTVSPYLGPESLNQTVDAALANNRGLFILAATSNPEARSLQSAIASGSSVAKNVYDYATGHSKGTFGSVGVVIGATVDCSSLGIDVEKPSNIPILVPGFGSQGVDLSSSGHLLKTFAPMSICSVSRSVAGSTKQGLAERISIAKSELEIGLRA